MNSAAMEVSVLSTSGPPKTQVSMVADLGKSGGEIQGEGENHMTRHTVDAMVVRWFRANWSLWY